MVFNNKKYRIDYCGQKGLYIGAKDKYAEGETVEFYYRFVATDTSYTFLLDGKEICVDYEHGRGFIIRFMMPSHDVTFSCIERNTMLREEGER